MAACKFRFIFLLAVVTAPSFETSDEAKTLPTRTNISASNGTLRASYGSSCSTTISCFEGLSCVDKVCVCTNSPSRNYDETTGNCISQAYGPCTSNLNCQASAHCRKINTTSITNNSSGHCICNEGYIPAPDGSCKLTHNQPCDSSSDCDPYPRLKCIDHHCRCQSFAVYAPEARKCLGLVGTSCSSVQQCIPNADCAAPYIGYPEICSCAPGYIEAGNYTCVLPPKEGKNYLALFEEPPDLF